MMAYFLRTHVRYATVADAIKLIKRAGPGCYLAKTDIKSAFRIIPIHPNDYPLLGMKWRGLYYYDRCMPMGCSSSCKTFETFSTAIEWIARHKLKIDELLHLLDDFLFVSATYMQCQSSLNLFIGLCHQLGIPIAPDKTFGPSTTLTFAGIELDSVKFEARLPRDKIAKCVDTINLFLKRKKVRLQELQSLIGLLNFATSVITPGTAFLRRQQVFPFLMICRCLINTPFARAMVFNLRTTSMLHFPWVGRNFATRNCFGVIFALTLLGKTMLRNMKKFQLISTREVNKY